MPNKPHLEVTAGLIWDGRKLLISRRPCGSHMGGYWEFPGGKRERGESLEQCLRRELLEELGLEVEISSPFITIDYEYDDRVVRLYSFNCRVTKGCAMGKEGQEVCWVGLGDLKKYHFPPPDAEIVNALLDWERGKSDKS